MTKTIYKNYDQQGLDAEYNNRLKVNDFLSYVAEGSALCATAKKEYPKQKNVCFDDKTGTKLDIIYPEGEDGSPYPVQLFIHGGYWKAFSKDDYTFVARAFAEYGIATVIIDYQLIPDITMDELVRQCRKSVAYLYENAAALNLDANNIHISGHSAGGHLVAMCMATDWSEFGANLPNQIVKSGVGISGLYDLKPISLCFLQDDLHLTEEEVERNSPVRLDQPTRSQLHLIVGGKEGPEYLDQNHMMEKAWPNCTNRTVVLAPYNHFSIVNSLADPTSALALFIRRAMGFNE